MSRTTRGGLLLVLCLIVVAGLVLTGCGKKEKALQQPGLEFTSYVKGSTVDFDDATLNNMAANGEAGFKYGIMKAMYPTIWGSNKDTVAQALFPAPYWKGDGVHTYYSYLSSGDQTTVDGTIFATKLSAAEQSIVVSAIEGFFGLYADEMAAAKALNQNTAYGVLAYKVSAAAAAAWETEATAWMTALNARAATNYSGKTYAQLTYIERKTVEGIVFANGAGTINPEYSFWRAMVETSFRNGNASARWPDKRDALTSSMYPGKTYAQLDCVQKPTVDGAVWASCNVTEQTAVNTQISGLYNLATEQVNGASSDNQNIYYYTLLSLPDYLTTDNSAATAAANWLAAVNGTTPGTTENTTFYAELLYGQAQWKSALAYQYFGVASYDNLTDVSKSVILEADAGMMSLSVAQRSAAMPLTSNVIYQTLKYRVGSTPAADGWAADAGAGIDRKLALYKWMAYESFRNGTAATFYPTQVADRLGALYPGKTAATLTACETITLNNAVWGVLGTGEQTYGSGAVSGMWGKVQAEMTDAVAIDQTTVSMTLRSSTGTETSVINFKADVESGTLLRQAFYRWLAKEKVTEMGAAALLIQQSVCEFYFKITNPNKYEIRIDELMLYFKTPVGASNEVIDGARQVLEDIWIPAEGEVDLKVLAPTKVYDLLSWLVMAGKDTNTARSLASQVFTKIQNGTVTWTCEADVQVSHGNDIENYSLSGAVGTVLAIV